MREMLEPIFGETGAIVAQFVITLVVVLLLIAVVVWLVRRYSGGAFAAGGRGRLPRLAIVDAMAVDNRRRLVLVRRDNVEHLLLIGGPSDIVVEPAILRTRTAAARTPQQAQAGVPVPSGPAPARGPVPPSAQARPTGPVAPAAAGEARPVERPAAAAPAAAQPRRVGVDQPIPFPPRRAPATPVPSARRQQQVAAVEEAAASAVATAQEPRARSRFAPVPSPVEPPAPPSEPAPARYEEPATGIESIFPPDDEGSPGPASAPEAEEPAAAFTPAAAEAADDVAAEPADEVSAEVIVTEAEQAEAMEVAPEPAAGEPEVVANARVSDLEKEMARLLGEISGRRS